MKYNAKQLMLLAQITMDAYSNIGHKTNHDRARRVIEALQARTGLSTHGILVRIKHLAAGDIAAANRTH